MLVDMRKIGFMQGRLTNKGGFFPQQFPTENWREEFETAREIGLQSVEWMFNYPEWTENPVMRREKLQVIQEKIAQTGIYVSGICANYFMKKSIFSEEESQDNINILGQLIDGAETIGCPNIIIPLFEASELYILDNKLIDIAKEFLGRKVQILLETDYDMRSLCWWLETAPANLGICYDIGNATGLGKNTVDEVAMYTKYIKNVHLKDKKLHGTTVMLGQGDALIEETLRALEKQKYDGCYILESYYGEQAIEDTTKNFNYIKDMISR